MYLTLVELPEYLRDADRLLDEDSQVEVKNFLARNPTAGAIMPGTNGVRKLRWARKGSGKRGGVRVIYYFYNETLPLFLLNIFGKNEKANLSKAERNDLAKLVSILVKTYGV
ncbi:type II toxin-antitoxin system RelE/ParE family toxin [candidate division KSB1 bacterium]|nr:type II toxin-antitoxin system RelE/ParE family toxin [candidate division KSB1 bacterium]